MSVIAKPKPSTFTARNKGGQTEITIYPRARGGFVFRYYLGGKPRTVERVGREEIIKEALRIADVIDSGLARTGKVTAADMESFVHATTLLEAGDPPLHAVVAEWKAARRIVGQGASLVQAARQWADLHPSASGPRKTAAEVLGEMIASKTNGRRRYDPHTFRVMQRSLEKFAASPAVADKPIVSVTEADIDAYLGTLTVAPRSRHNVRTSIITLFRFGQRRRYLPEDRKTEAEKVAKEHWIRKPAAIFTPDELRAYLAHVRPELLPWMVLGAFAGIRTEEICGDEEDDQQEQLEWRDVIWEEQVIHVRPEVGKTDEGRIVPINEALMSWLLPFKGCKGFVCPKQAAYWRETSRLARPENAGVKWRKNGLRHSHASYQYALDRDMQKLTAAMGNSARINRQYYQNPQFPRIAREWFSIKRAEEGTLIQFQAS